ncbi:conserved hypothetical protein [Haliangium ochraceum DSM 14365]|uniref:Polymerase nucleotidyl transferase domain-containing protein n=2 Tax=Haliangium ochraceum TaxID=80816 RepID=D0LJ45_HALO1|nr:conserved hypothetical protein [Haliangium ochraceum DSM 14365]
MIVFGSLARGEWTGGSDVDWTLLVDGQADPEHLSTVQQITGCLADLKYKEPGRTALFGGLAFSHGLIHQIGGEHDTNRNTTQRILLLLESAVVGGQKGVRERVIRQLLRRYVNEDYEYRDPRKTKPRVPRFLLNDVVRYWRTMAVDAAAKRREREGQGWALRNFKLQMSRKLIFAAGLAACLGCKLKPGPAWDAQDSVSSADNAALDAAVESLFGFAECTPLELLARTVLDFDAIDAANDLYGAYDAFLGILCDPEKRDRLRALTKADAFGDELFGEARDIGKRFQSGLTKLFFDTDDELTKATQRYGVF